VGEIFEPLFMEQLSKLPEYVLDFRYVASCFETRLL